VDYVGVSNLFTFLQTIPPYWKPMLAKMQDMVGDPVRDQQRLAATSPALHVDRIKTPLFIAQGAKDPRVNKDESDQVVKALKARGIEVAYMVKENEGHGFHNDENKFDFYAAMEQFFIKHLKP
jgi:dipeptidyl aminopeptidase/acylaminoacyl peptidase